MDKLIELLQQIQDLAGVAINALQQAAGGGGGAPTGGGNQAPRGEPTARPAPGGQPSYEGR
jgi:hypothetical protein